MSVEWKPNGTGNSYEAFNGVSGDKERSATRTDLVLDQILSSELLQKYTQVMMEMKNLLMISSWPGIK